MLRAAFFTCVFSSPKRQLTLTPTYRFGLRLSLHERNVSVTVSLLNAMYFLNMLLALMEIFSRSSFRNERLRPMP